MTCPYLTPAAGCEAKINDGHTRPKQTVAIIDLQELESRSALQTSDFGGLCELILTLSLNPSLAAILAANMLIRFPEAA
jgi:hypothetical protein